MLPMPSLRALLLLSTFAAGATGCRPSSPGASPPDGGPASQLGPAPSLANPGTGGAPTRTPTVPAMRSLVLVDFKNMDINAAILVVGAGANDFLDHVHRRTSDPADGGSFIDATSPGEASLTYVPLRLGDIRGWHTRLHLYGLDADERALSTIAELAPQAHGVVLVEKDPGDSDRAVRAVAERLAGSAVPVALLGADALAPRWRALGGPKPVFSGPPGEGSVFPALKSVAKGVLAGLRSGNP
jgi:hypothetical protein